MYFFNIYNLDKYMHPIGLEPDADLQDHFILLKNNSNPLAPVITVLNVDYFFIFI